MAPRSRLRGRSQTRRRVGQREPLARFIVVVEGEVTEWQFLTEINAITAPLVTVRPLAPNESPWGLATEAVEVRRSARRVGGWDKRDQVWVFFDVDQYAEELRRAKARLDGEDIPYVVSNPSFEIWLLCHFEYSSAERSASDWADYLGRYIPGYSARRKHLPVGALAGRLQEAQRNAQRLDTHHTSAGNPPSSDPSTTVGTFVRALCDVAGVAEVY